METQQISFGSYTQKALEAYRAHGISVEERQLRFSNLAMQEALFGNWNRCVTELRDQLESTLSSLLSPAHVFEALPYVRDMKLPCGKTISIAIVNQQSREWYGAENTIGSFDFLLEKERGAFDDCQNFLDLGGHQLIWAIYYALTGKESRVTSFEPSILNILIGLFNCLLNGVIDRVNVVPFAVAVETAAHGPDDADKMLVDYMTVPLRTCNLTEWSTSKFDFVKIDIEGYEYELLSDRSFLKLVAGARKTHFELHLGHLIKRNVSLEDCINALKAAGLNGVELYSQKEMYSFLGACDRNGYYSFLLG